MELEERCWNLPMEKSMAKTVYPGVIITIGPSSLHVKDTVKYATFMRDEGEIRFVSYEG